MDGKTTALIGLGVGIVIILALAVTFLQGKGASLLAGYNTMPEEGQKHFDIDSLLRFVGRALLLCAFFMADVAYGIWIENALIAKISLLLAAATLIWVLARSNSARYRR